MVRFSATFFSCLFALSAGTAGAQVRGTHDEQLWINVTGMGEAGDLVYFLEVQPRIGTGVSRLDQLMLRGAIGLKLAPGVTLQQGYARVRTPATDRIDTVEDRSFQQLGWKLSPRLSSRTRLEQRWLSTGSDTGWRLREMLRFATPLQRDRKTGVAALVYAEGFFALNDTDWGARAGFDRLRGFIGAEVPVGGKSTVEIGYLNQYVNQARRGDTVDHVASISLFLRPS